MDKANETKEIRMHQRMLIVVSAIGLALVSLVAIVNGQALLNKDIKPIADSIPQTQPAKHNEYLPTNPSDLDPKNRKPMELIFTGPYDSTQELLCERAGGYWLTIDNVDLVINSDRKELLITYGPVENNAFCKMHRLITVTSETGKVHTVTDDTLTAPKGPIRCGNNYTLNIF